MNEITNDTQMALTTKKLTYGFIFSLPAISTDGEHSGQNLPIQLTKQFEIMRWKKFPTFWRWLHD